MICPSNDKASWLWIMLKTKSRNSVEHEQRNLSIHSQAKKKSNFFQYIGIYISTSMWNIYAVSYSTALLLVVMQSINMY